MLETVKTYDFIIVGSGIGGLVSANILAMEGYSVLVLEKNHQIGGNLQVFSRDQCIFDTGVHYIGGLDKGQNLHQIFKYLGIIDELNIHRLDDHGFDRIIFSDGREYKHAHGYECFIKSLLVDFPDELEAHWPILENRILANIASSIWGKEYLFQQLLKTDDQANKALDSFDRAKKLIYD